ncbi:uncharacterized protein G6M90_00g080120 [Metarhizium brunneum]|uniref:Oligopeptide transporter n=1 Tax=Metarhizium brunneum TaxID=500148 RepID=A0A7D5Z179_9HYPO
MEASRQPGQDNDSHAATLTPRAVACGILLGIVVCLANIYFGLQAGMVSPMPMQSALLGFAIFQSIRPRLSKALTPMETTLIEVIAGSLGLAPFTLGLTSFIPALEFLTKPEENGPFKFTNGQLLLWAMATCGLGIIAAVPFRRLLILRESLPYPSATATGALIGILFKRPDIIARAKQTQMRPRASRVSDINNVYSERDEADPGGDTERLLDENSRREEEEGLGRDTNRPALRMLLYALAASLSFSFIAYFLPILHRVPIFGLHAASHWMWAFDLSPAYIGYGVIIGPSINAYVLIGAIVGWGILSPVAKHRGWAPGPITDFENGPRGWILCVGLGFILGDTIVAVGWICSKPFICRARRWVSNIVQRKQLSSSHGQRDGTETPLLRESPSSVNTANETAMAQDDGWPKSCLITTRLVGWIGAALLLLYFISIPTAFGHLTSVPATLLAALLIPLAGFISMRSMGETDNGASVAIGRFAQFAIARLFSFSGPKFTSANLLLGGAIESGASQAAQQMGNLKIASITQIAPRAVIFAQMIGSYVGAFIAIFFYKIYSSLDKIPSEEFSIPDAHLYITTSRFIRWQGLPPGLTGFLMGSFALGAVFSVLRILSLKHWWRCLVPSGIAIAIGE